MQVLKLHCGKNPGRVPVSYTHLDVYKRQEPYYPVNDPANNELYAKYERRALEEKNVIFGGRLGMYRYMDMDRVIEEALNLAETELVYCNENE